MDILYDENLLSLWLTQYGSIALFGLLALGILALPIPEETLMVLAGILMYQSKLLIVPTILAAFGGAICGISLSYLLGRVVGKYFILKWGRYLGLTEKKFAQAHNWFETYGKWTLLIGYFIPGVRHLTGACAGVTNLHFGAFALFAYAGAILWASTFLSIGYFFSDYFIKIIEYFEPRFEFLILFALGLGLLFFIARVIFKNYNSK